jgi:hypothetical protein
VIYLTHGAPNEPSFSAVSLVKQMSPVPLAAIHSTKGRVRPDLRDPAGARRGPGAEAALAGARGDHRFSGNVAELDRCLAEAITWIRDHSSH